MSLFVKKVEPARPVRIEKLPSLPDFPDLPEEGSSFDMPSYESSMGDIKREVEKGPEFEIPERELRSTPKFAENFAESVENKPLFIKIESYKAAYEELENLKEKLSQAESILDDLEQIRDQEANKLESWRRDIASLKEKLLTIDQHLFEV
jgi:hypothetical protein